jgi:hypothetical protein
MIQVSHHVTVHVPDHGVEWAGAVVVAVNDKTAYVSLDEPRPWIQDSTRFLVYKDEIVGPWRDWVINTQQR